MTEENKIDAISNISHETYKILLDISEHTLAEKKEAIVTIIETRKRLGKQSSVRILLLSVFLQKAVDSAILKK